MVVILGVFLNHSIDKALEFTDGRKPEKPT